MVESASFSSLFQNMRIAPGYNQLCAIICGLLSVNAKLDVDIFKLSKAAPKKCSRAIKTEL